MSSSFLLNEEENHLLRHHLTSYPQLIIIFTQKEYNARYGLHDDNSQHHQPHGPVRIWSSATIFRDSDRQGMRRSASSEKIEWKNALNGCSDGWATCQRELEHGLGLNQEIRCGNEGADWKFKLIRQVINSHFLNSDRSESKIPFPTVWPKNPFGKKKNASNGSNDGKRGLKWVEKWIHNFVWKVNSFSCRHAPSIIRSESSSLSVLSKWTGLSPLHWIYRSQHQLVFIQSPSQGWKEAIRSGSKEAKMMIIHKKRGYVTHYSSW